MCSSDLPTDGDALRLVTAWAERELGGRVMVCDPEGRVIAGAPDARATTMADVAPAAVVRAMASHADTGGGGAGAVLGPSSDPARTWVWARMREGEASLGTLVGERLSNRVSQDTFNLIIAVMLLLSGVSLLIK